MEDAKTEFVKSIFILLITIPAVIILALMSGFVFSTLWGWFVIPATGFAAIGYWHATGISLTISFIRLKLKTHEPVGEKVNHWSLMFQSLLIPPTVLFFGWLIKLAAGL